MSFEVIMPGQGVGWEAERQALGGTDLGVAADDGVVTLSGTVSRRARRLAAQETALRVPGVRDVRNRIVIADVLED
jgi:osmotically-inducible protein OsmY